MFSERRALRGFFGTGGPSTLRLDLHPKSKPPHVAARRFHRM